MSEPLHQCHIVVRLIIGPFRQLMVHLLQLVLYRANAIKSLFRLLPYRMSVTEDHHLRQISHSGTPRYGHCTLCGSLQSCYHLEHSALARTILAHQSYSVTVVDHITDICKQRACAELHTQMVY